MTQTQTLVHTGVACKSSTAKEERLGVPSLLQSVLRVGHTLDRTLYTVGSVLSPRKPICRRKVYTACLSHSETQLGEGGRMEEGKGRDRGNLAVCAFFTTV